MQIISLDTMMKIADRIPVFLDFLKPIDVKQATLLKQQIADFLLNKKMSITYIICIDKKLIFYNDKKIRRVVKLEKFSLVYNGEDLCFDGKELNTMDGTLFLDKNILKLKNKIPLD